MALQTDRAGGEMSSVSHVRWSDWERRGGHSCNMIDQHFPRPTCLSKSIFKVKFLKIDLVWFGACLSETTLGDKY